MACYVFLRQQLLVVAHERVRTRPARAAVQGQGSGCLRSPNTHSARQHVQAVRHPLGGPLTAVYSAVAGAAAVGKPEARPCQPLRPRR